MKRIAVTFEHDHSDMTGIWKDYYSKYLDIKIVKIGDILRRDWGATYSLLNSLQEELFKEYDLILFADIDEIVVANPEKYKDLGEYLDRVKESAVRCVGYNVLQMVGDKPIDLSKPILSQRTHWSRDEMYDKCVIITKPQVYLSNHRVKGTTLLDADLIMLHLRDIDVDLVKERNKKIGAVYNERDLEHRRSIANLIPGKWKLI